MTASFLNLSWATTLFDAAARSLLMAGAVAIGLRLFHVNNVRARKVAWVLVLVGAVTMPVLAPWAESQAWLPVGAAVVPVRTWLEQVANWRKAAAPRGFDRATHPIVHPSRAANRSIANRSIAKRGDAQTALAQAPYNSEALTGDHFPSPSISMSSPGLAPEEQRMGIPLSRTLSLSQLAFLAYFAITAALLLRLAVGLVSAVRLWALGKPVALAADPQVDAELRVRWSPGISSPVTIGSGILLPEDYRSWDTEKLRIVLAHESSHVRQGDFYIQLCAALYAAAFWFSPLGWWLKRTLCDLSETISDGAAVDQAASHASYAQVLLEFAALPRTTRIGVAMARSGRLSHRIERLLDEGSFRKAFAGGRGRMLVAALLAPMALFAATSLIRVEAAGQTPPTPAAPPAPTAPPSTTAPLPPAAPEANEVPPPAPAAPAEQPEVPPAPPAPPEMGEGESYSVSVSQSDSNSNRNSRRSSSHSSTGNGYSYWYSDNGDSYALISGSDKQHVQFSGDWMEGRHEELDKARRMVHGDFLWFTHEGKSYVVDDPAIVSELIATYKPMDDLGRQQEELGRKQEELGRQQEKMGERMNEASIPTPDVSKEMAALNAAMAELNAAKGKTVTQDQLAELQEKLADLQGRLGGLQGEVGAKQGEIGRMQGELGEKQGELGAQQGRLGAEQGRIAREADRKVKSVIDQSLKNGKARPVE